MYKHIHTSNVITILVVSNPEFWLEESKLTAREVAMFSRICQAPGFAGDERRRLVAGGPAGGWRADGRASGWVSNWASRPVASSRALRVS